MGNMSISFVGRRGRTAVGRLTKARVMLAAVFAANLLMYIVYRTFGPRAREAEISAPAAAPDVKAETAPATRQPSPAAATPRETARQRDDFALARAHRVAGLAALEGGEYGSAVKEFSQALRLGEAGNDTAELLRIARDLQDKAAAREAQAKVAEREAKIAEEREREALAAEKARAAAAVAKPASAASRKRASPVVAKASRVEPSEEGTGVLLVTSTPSGLLVEVDGRRVDFTPARLKVESGLHTVAILQGDNRLYERRVEVADDGVHSIDPDLTEKLRPAPREEARVAAPAAAAAEPVEADGELAEPDEPAPAPPVRPAAAPTPERQVLAFGELHVLSAGVYGDVWINGESYGKPPLVARNIPSGPATVEIRVNGSVRRSKVVEVPPSRRTTIRLR